MDDVAWDDRLPPAGKALGILRLKADATRKQVLKALVYAAPARVGVWLHYVDRRSLPCRQGACPYCPMRRQKRWYLPALAQAWRPDGNGVRPWIEWLLELTTDNVMALGQVEAPGAEIELSRPAGGECTRTRFQVLSNPFVPKAPIAQWSAGKVEDCLWRIWYPDELPPEAEGGIDLTPKDPPTVPFRGQRRA